MKINKIYQGDTLDVLKTFPDESVNMVVTSPPYYGLRKYGDYKEQIGLEDSFEEYLDKMMAVMKEIKRVVKKEGQIWINFGDCFGGSPAGNKSISEANQGYDGVFVRKAKQGQGAKSFVYSTDNERMFSGKSNNSRLKQTVGEKCLLMMPERFAIRCIDELGLILRNKIKWAKQILDYKRQKAIGSVMPTPVKDRFNESGEELYFFVKQKKYFSDLDAVRLKNPEPNIERPRIGKNQFQSFNYRVRDARRKSGQPQFKAGQEEISKYDKGSEYEQKYGEPWDRFGQKTLKVRMIDTKNKDQKTSRTYNIKKLLSEVRLLIKPNTGIESNKVNNPRCNAGKNLPTVWFIGSEPHNFQKELGVDIDHFAIFPQALLEIPIKFGCPPNGLVLDPFVGSGTTCLVARNLGKNFIGIELNEKYIEIANKRMSQNILL